MWVSNNAFRSAVHNVWCFVNLFFSPLLAYIAILRVHSEMSIRALEVL